MGKIYPVTAADTSEQLEAEILRLEDEIKQLKKIYASSIKDLAYGTGRSTDGLPQARGGVRTSRPESLAIDSLMQAVPETLRPLYLEIRAAENKVSKLRVRKGSIKSWLDIINQDDRFVIENHIFKQIPLGELEALSYRMGRGMNQYTIQLCLRRSMKLWEAMTAE